MGVRALVDVVALGRGRPWTSRALGVALWALHCCRRCWSSTRIRFAFPCISYGRPGLIGGVRGRWSVGRDPRREVIIERVAALDIGKAEVVCCVRVPPVGRAAVAGGPHLDDDDAVAERDGDWLRGLGVTRVVMEATSDYWKPPFYLLEAAGFEAWLVNARDVKHLPGRPKTDRLDAVWLCKVAERQMLRPSFVPPEPIRRLRDLTRYRMRWWPTSARRRTGWRSCWKTPRSSFSVVASDIFGVSGRAMMAALIGGERDPMVLAAMARARMRKKIPQLGEAFVGPLQ